MTEKLMFDDGILELEINGNGVMRFNPSDQNMYQRVCTLAQELPKLQERYEAEVETPEGDELAQAVAVLDRMREFDREVKGRLAEAFGPENDFDRLLGGVNMMAYGRNGERVITNFLNAIMPYLEEGMKQYRQDAAATAVAEAKQNRAARRAKK